MAKAAEYKKKVIAGIVDLIKQYPITATINMENLPAPQLQKMRAELRAKVVMTMTKRRLIKIAFEEAEKSKKGIKELSNYLEGMPALLFTKESPFKLYNTLQKNKSAAPAKGGQTAPKDIIIPAGPTSFAPGPIIGELAMAGIKSGVEGGKVAIKADSLVAKKGDKIKPKTAEILTRLGIQPMEVGLDLVAAYEDGVVYNKDVLEVEETKFMCDLSSAASGALNLAMFISYPTKDTIELLISKASDDAKAIGLSQNIIDDEIIEQLIGKAESRMMTLKNTANIEVPEKPKTQPKDETKKEETKLQEQKSAEKKEAVEKKEEKALSEEKEIIEEEKKLEEQKPADTPVEKEVQEAVKEEEEKKLEKERIEKEKEIEKIEKEKEQLKKAEEKKLEKERIEKAEKNKAEMEKTEKLVQELKKKGTLR